MIQKTSNAHMTRTKPRFPAAFLELTHMHVRAHTHAYIHTDTHMLALAGVLPDL